MKDAMTYAHEAGFFSFNVVGWKAEFEQLIKAVRAEYEAPLRLAEKLLSEIHRGNTTPMAEESWDKALAAIREALAEQSMAMILNDPHPPHRLCECTACLEYWTPLPDCDAFAGGGKPIDHIADTGKMVRCAYCDTNLLAGSECSNCGRVTIAEPANTRSTSEYSEPVKQEPVAYVGWYALLTEDKDK